MLAEGTYRGRADKTAITWGMSQAGNEQLAISIILTEARSRLVWMGNFSNDKAMEISVKALRAMGWDGVAIDGPNALNGIGSVECDFVVVHEEYEGNVRAKILFVNTPGFNFKNELPAERKASLATRLKGFMAGRSDAPRTYAQKQDAKQTQEWDGQGPDPNDHGALPF